MTAPYRWLAEYYEEVFSPLVGYLDPARERLLGPLLPRIESACDLACGPGRTAVLLARKGIRMCGVDLSPGMCRAARQNARRAGVPLRVIRADMRDFRLPEPVDLVLCEFDALNHVPRKEDLGRVLRSVWRALRPGGYFYFDVNNSAQFQKIWAQTWFTETPNAVMVMHGGYNAATDSVWADVEWFLRKGRLWRRRRERVEEVCWSGQEMRSALRAAGFGTVRSWDAARLLPATVFLKKGYRTFYLAHKPVRAND